MIEFVTGQRIKRKGTSDTGRIESIDPPTKDQVFQRETLTVIWDKGGRETLVDPTAVERIESDVVIDKRPEGSLKEGEVRKDIKDLSK